jgi:hypothetical protein
VSPSDVARELRLRRVALPAALALAWLVVGRHGAGLSRVFLTMWVHELGHAVTGWLCGFMSIPGPWRTPRSEMRVPIVSVLLAAGLVAWAIAGVRARRTPWVVGAGALLLAQAVLTLGVRSYTAKALIAFGGDAGLFVLGSALMLTFYAAPPGGAFHRTQLRWGFLVIGAFAFMDGLHTWRAARRDPDTIPYGEIEGVGPSDPTNLVQEYFWTERDMIDRYLRLALVCTLVLALVYAWGALTRPRPAADE